MVVIDLDAHRFQAFPVGHGAGLAAEMGDDNAVYAEAAVQEFVAEAEDVHVVGDPEVCPDFVLLDVHGADDDDDLGVILHLHEHFEFTVRLETRQDAAGVVIIEEFTAELHVELVAESGDAVPDVFRLDLEILSVVEPVFHKSFS